MRIIKLEPECNLNTIRDGRGGIFTFYPRDPVVEWNFQFVNKGKIRGNHYHPEFDEYYLFVEGHAVLVTRDQDGKEEFLHVNKGDCVHIPIGVPHVIYAITDFNVITFLTKKWNDCDVPIIHENLGMGTGDHGDPNWVMPDDLK